MARDVRKNIQNLEGQIIWFQRLVDSNGNVSHRGPYMKKPSINNSYKTITLEAYALVKIIK